MSSLCLVPNSAYTQRWTTVEPRGFWITFLYAGSTRHFLLYMTWIFLQQKPNTIQLSWFAAPFSWICASNHVSRNSEFVHFLLLSQTAFHSTTFHYHNHHLNVTWTASDPLCHLLLKWFLKHKISRCQQPECKSKC